MGYKLKIGIKNTENKIMIEKIESVWYYTSN